MKRTLALVLALVMVLGMMAIPASADFTDSKDVKYTEAVDVVSACGIINGFEDGSFDPDGTLTREQAAKIVAYMLLGSDKADSMKATTAPFADVAANRWSAGYIAYVANEGIINGRDEKTFDPTGNVTAYEFAKLMLGALGYDSAIEEYTGVSWAINVGKTALTIDLFDGNDGADYNKPATREEAALYVFNTLKADLVEYENKGSNIDLGNGITINTGASKAEPAAVRSSDKVSNIVDESEKGDNYAAVQFAERYFKDLKCNTETKSDDFGRPATKWTYDGDKVGTYAKDADLTYTTGTKGKTIYSDLDKPDSTATYTYYVDGKPVSNADGIKTGFAIASGNDVKAGGNGALIEVYDMDNDAYRVVIINTYVATIAAWNEADDDKNEKESVDIAEITAPGTARDSLNTNFETTQFSDKDEEDDGTVVLYTAAWDEDEDEYAIQSVVAASSVTATVTSYTKGDKLVAGDTYKYSFKADSDKIDDIAKNSIDDDEDIVIYTDSYGYVIYVDGDTTSSDDYAYVEKVEKSVGQFSDGYVAKIVLGGGKGETTIVNLNEDYTDKFDDETAAKAALDGSIVTYSTNKDGEYTFDSVVKATTGALDITKGVSKVMVGENKKYTDSKTVFFVQDDDDYDVYVGIANVPSIESDTGAYTAVAYVTDKNGQPTDRIAAVYVSDSTSSSTNSDDFVIVAFDQSKKSDYNSDMGNYYVYNVIVNGEKTTMNFDADLVESENSAVFTSSTDAIYVLSSVTVDKDDVVTKVKLATKQKDKVYSATGTVKVKDELIGLGDELFSYDSKVDVFKIDSDCKITASSINSIKTDSNDKVAYVTDDDGIVTAIYILEVKD